MVHYFAFNIEPFRANPNIVYRLRRNLSTFSRVRIQTDTEMSRRHKHISTILQTVKNVQKISIALHFIFIRLFKKTELRIKMFVYIQRIKKRFEHMLTGS